MALMSSSCRTVNSFKEIWMGKHDKLPEDAFRNVVGSIEDVVAKGCENGI